jgi:pantoate--beta-alanine ligase
MGALHEGHEALFSAARTASDSVVASIFVNPLQFGPGEDLASYPRTLEADLERCAANGVDIAFTPDVETVYPGGEPQVTIDPGPLAAELEGASRPGHFRGVLTVVTKLFGLVRPDLAVFGTKDYQQLVLIRRCARDLCMPVEILDVETIRAPDGLALSSRNRYLSPSERLAAVTLSKALVAGQAAGRHGARAVLAAASAVLDGASEVVTDYLDLRSPDLTDPPASGGGRLLVAARVGSTRLIDNVGVTLGSTVHSLRVSASAVPS